MKLSEMRIDRDAKEQGEWVPSPYLPGVRIKARGYGNADHRLLVAKQGRELSAAFASGSEVSLDIQDANELDLLTKTLLVDWEGVTEEDGTVITCGSDRAHQLLADPELALLRMSVTHAASANTFKRKVALGDASKN